MLIIRLCPQLPEQKHKEGFLSTYTKDPLSLGKTWKKYFSELKKGYLSWQVEGGAVKRVEITNNAVIAKISLPDQNHVFAIIAENTGKSYGFTTYYFSAATQQEKQEWIHVAIQNGAHMLERYENPPNLTSLALLTPSGSKLSVDVATEEVTCLPKAVVTSVDNLFWMERRGPEEVCFLLNSHSSFRSISYHTRIPNTSL